jgi:hypothetical protein
VVEVVLVGASVVVLVVVDVVVGSGVVLVVVGSSVVVDVEVVLVLVLVVCGASVVVDVVVDVVVEVVVGALVVATATQLLPWQTPLPPPRIVQGAPGVAEVTQTPPEQETVWHVFAAGQSLAVLQRQE